MSGVNKCHFVGNVGQDPKYVRDENNGHSRVTLRLACDEMWRDKATGEKQARTEWVPIVFFGRIADAVGSHVHKGDKLYVEGKFQTRKLTDAQGQDKYYTEIYGLGFEFMGGGKPKQQAEDSYALNQQDYKYGNDNDYPF